MGSFYFYTMSAAHPIGVLIQALAEPPSGKKSIHYYPTKTPCISPTAKCPLWEQDPEEIIALSIKNTEWLLQHQCKIIVVACNTATTNAIKVLRSRYSVPFIGIEPAIKPAALQTKTKSIGILATKEP